MSLGMTTLLIIAAYISLLLIVGVGSSFLSRGTSKDYMLASHSIGPFLLLMSLFGTTMTAFALVGSTGEAYVDGVGVYGLLASSSGIVHSLCFFLIGVKVWDLGRRYNYNTQIQFFRDRLESDKIGIVLFPVLVGLVVPYLLIGVMSSGLFVQGITMGRAVDGAVVNGTFEEDTFPGFLEDGQKGFAVDGSRGGLPKHLASLVICCVVLIYVFFGGMRGTAWANAFQTMIFMVLGVVTFYIIAMAIGKGETLLESMQNASASIPHDKLTRSEMSMSKFLTYLFIPLSVGMFPHLFQHWLTAKNANAFKTPVICHPVFIMIVWAPCIMMGVWAASELVSVPPPVHANPNTVLPFMVKKFAGTIWNGALLGLLAAGVLAAIMSSLDSQFLCLGTIFTEDIVKHYGGKDLFSDKQYVLIARCFIIGIVLFTYLLSLLEPGRVFTLGVWCFSGFSALFPLVFAAVYWKGLTKAGAYACVLTAFGTWGYLFRQSNYGLNDSYALELPLGGVTYDLMPVTLMILLATIAMVVVSLVTPKPSAETLQKFFPEKS